MPPGFGPPHPGGMAENSPTFQCAEFRGAQVPKGRLNPCAIRQPSLRDLSGCGRWFPTLKRWAIIGCPSGTKTCPGLACFVGANPNEALDHGVWFYPYQGSWPTTKNTKNAKPGTWERERLHPPEVGSISPTAGFSLCSLRSLWLNGSVWFYPCHPWSKSLTAPKP